MKKIEKKENKKVGFLWSDKYNGSMSGNTNQKNEIEDTNKSYIRNKKKKTWIQIQRT